MTGIKHLWGWLLLVCSLTTHAGEPLSPEAFTDVFIAEMHQSMPNIPLEEKGVMFLEATTVDGSKLSIYLDNVYQLYLAGKGSPRELVADQIASIAETLDSRFDAPLDESRVFPVIKNNEYLQEAEAHFKTQSPSLSGKALHSRRLNKDLVVLYVQDTPTSMKFLRPADLEKLGKDSEALHALATENLQRHYRETGVTIQQLDSDGTEQIFVISIDEVYETSVLLAGLPQDKSLFPVDGEPVIFLPARGIVFVVGSKDTPGIKLASHIAKLAYEDMGYSISPFGYQLTDQGWQRYQ